MIPYARQNITNSDIEAVVKVLRSDFLTQGPAVPTFEKAISDYCKVNYCVAVSSATSALHVACLALGLKSGDWLWTSPNTFVASANCGLYCGANIDFVDINPDTYNLCVEALEKKLIKADAEGKLPKIVIPVHFAGRPCDMKKIYALSQRYGFRIIEDASHAIGADLPSSKIGACEYSDITVFSFHPVKIITTGEGGAATTNDAVLAERLSLFRSHGVTRNRSLMDQEGLPDWYYQQIDLGYNYRLTDIQAALGVSQIKTLDDNINQRTQLAYRYDELLSDLNVKPPSLDFNGRSALHLYVIQLNSSTDRKNVFDYLRRKGIAVNVHYIPVHYQPFYQSLGFKVGDFPNAEAYYENAISLPMYPILTTKQQDEVISNLRKILHFSK